MNRFLIFLLLSLIFVPQADAFTDDNYTAALHYFNHGHWTKAAKYFTRVTLSDPDNWRAYQGLGDCEFHLRHREEAMAASQVSLTLNPQNKALEDFVDDQTTMPPPPIPPEEPQAIPGSPAAIPSAPFPSLPQIHSTSFRLDLGGGLSSPDDFNSVYNVNYTDYGTMANLDLGVDLDYTLTPNFQVGVGLAALVKRNLDYESERRNDRERPVAGTSLGRPCGRTLVFTGALGNVIFAAQFGYFSLFDSTVNVTQTNGASTVKETLNLIDNQLGGNFQVEYEFTLNQKLKMDVGIGYRLLRFSPITVSGPGGSAVLRNPDSSYSWIDFSGPELTMSLVFI